jgi:hypothetical protein
MKKIYFDGCSYTFGQSLELYCNPLDIFTENRMSHYKFTDTDMEFIKSNRYSGIISKNYGFYEINKSRNGKPNGRILFDLKHENINDYEYVIIQLTHFGRFFTNDMHEWISSNHSIEWMIEKGFLSQEIVDYTINNINKIQYGYYLELISLFENNPNKLKIIFHSDEWEDILTKEEIEKYGIAIDGEYMIRKWAENNNMFINQQPEFKTNIATLNDTHLILQGHKILAKSITEQL